MNEVGLILQELSSISSFFHTSGLRSRELRDIAEANNLQLQILPAYFEVRWTQYSATLINAVLVSWHALCYSEDKQARGFLLLLTNAEKLDLLAFMADVLGVFSRYQKKLQRDDVTILDMEKATTSVKAKLLALREENLLGGWAMALENEVIKKPDGTKTLKDILLTSRPAKRRQENHRYVSDRRR